MFKGKLEPGWINSFFIFHILKLMYFLASLTYLYRRMVNVDLWSGPSHFWIPLLLFFLNLLILIPALGLRNESLNLFIWIRILIIYDICLLIAEHYLHFKILQVNDFFQSIFKVMPPYIFSLIFIVLIAWQFKVYHFVLIALFRMIMNVLFVYRFQEMQFLNWFLWNLFELTSLILMGSIVYYLVLQQRNVNLQLHKHATTVEELAVSWERNRLARELHDTLAHSFSALAVQLEASRKFLDKNPEETRKFLDEAQSITANGLNDTRQALKALRSAPLEDLGLNLALKEEAENAARRMGAHCHFKLPESPVNTFSPHEELALYRIAQETLENCVRHSGAENLYLSFDVHSQEFTLEIKDDGRGFDIHKQIDGKWGLLGMKERADLIDAHFSILSQIGKGSRMVLSRKGSWNENSDRR